MIVFHGGVLFLLSTGHARSALWGFACGVPFPVGVVCPVFRSTATPRMLVLLGHRASCPVF